MKRHGNIEMIRAGLIDVANRYYATKSQVRLGGALEAVDEYCDALIAKKDLLSNNITSYSIQGRSITKRSITELDTILSRLYNNLLDYFDEVDMPAPPASINTGIKVNFSYGAP